MVNRGEEKVRVHMNVVPRSTGNTNRWNRELTLKCKFKCYLRVNVHNGETYRGNSQKLNSAHILRLGRP